MSKTVRLLLLLVAGLTQAAMAEDGDKPVTPKISLSEPKIVGKANNGQSVFRSLAFESNVNLDAATIWISPRLRKYLTTQRESFPDVARGEQVDVSVRIDIPIDYRRRRLFGFIFVVGTVSDSGKRIGRILPVSFRVREIPKTEFSNDLVSISVPEVGVNFEVLTDSAPEYTLEVAYENEDGGFGASAFAIYFAPKAQNQSLQNWFSSEVDLSGTLLGTGAFQLDALSSGNAVLVSNLPIPDAHADLYGPVSSFYAELADGSVVAIANVSQAHNLAELGYVSGDVQTDLLRRILDSVSVSDALRAGVHK